MTWQSCPTCGTEIPTDPRFVTWCHSCGWNLEPPDPRTGRTGPLGRISETAGRRLDEALFARLAEDDALRSRLTPAKTAAYAVAICVHAFVLALVVLGSWLVVADRGVILKVLGVLLLGLAFLMRPRLGRRPTGGVLPRDDAPVLYGLVDEVAQKLRTRSPHTIVVTAEYNASWSVVGLRRQRFLSLGLPLLTALAPDERVALVGHEVAHARNGDASRGLVVGSAIEALWQLYVTLAPGSSRFAQSDLDVAELIGRPFVWLLAQPIRLLLLLEYQLLLRDSHRAEYLADGLAAEVAGTSAVVGLHEKVLLEGTAAAAVHRAAVAAQATTDDVFDVMRIAFEEIPERERERRRRIARLESVRLDATHPPTGRRIELLEQRPARTAAVTLDPARDAAIERELATVRPQLSRRLVDDYRASIEY